MDPVLQLIADILEGKITSAEALSERIRALSDTQLAEFETAALNTFDSIRAGETTVEGDVTEVVTRIADATEAVRVDAERRMTEATEAAAAIDAQDARMRPVAEEAGAEGGGEGEEPAEGEEPEEPAAAEPAEGTEPVEGEEPAAEPAPAEANGAVPEPVAAAITSRVRRPDVRALAANRQRSQAPQPAAEASGVRIIAGAEIQGITAGGEIQPNQLAEAFMKRADALARLNPRHMTAAVPYHVASIEGKYPDAQVLGDNASANEAIIASNMKSLSAAGGVCAPAVPIYDQIAISEDTRPIRGALPVYGATRGGVIITPSPVWDSYTDGISQWTQQDDIDAVDDEDVRKPCMRVDCADPITYRTYALPVCLTVGNWFEKSFPERLEAILQGITSFQARFAERLLLQQIEDLPMLIDSPAISIAGATRSFIFALRKKVASFRQRFRVSRSYKLELWLPQWLLDLLISDLAMSMTGGTFDENFRIADATIQAWIEQIGVNITWLWEGAPGLGQEFVGVNDDWPDHIIGYLFHAGALGLLDQGRIDLGVQRSPDLNASNDLQIWAESFEGIFYQGLEIQKLDFEICPNGQVAGTVDISDLVCPGVS